MTPREAEASRAVVLRALDLVEQAMDAETAEEAVELARQDLEVLDRSMLVMVAAALAVETSRRWVAPAHRQSLRQRLARARLEHMWAGS